MLTRDSSGFSLGLGSDASEFMDPETSITMMQWMGRRSGLSFAAMVKQASAPDAWHSRVTSWHGRRSAEKLMLMIDGKRL
jgi:hypothetical protein